MMRPDKLDSCELVVFDLDGTLIDSRADIAASVNFTLTSLSLEPLSEEKITSFIGRGVKNLLTTSLGVHAEEHFDRALKIFRTHYKAHCLDRTVLYPGAQELLGAMSGRLKAIVTNKPHVFTEIVLDGLAIRNYFKQVLSGDRVPRKKPAPDSLIMLMNEFHIKPERILMVGDSPLDIQMGKAVGAHTCAVSYGYGSAETLREAGPEFTISKLLDLRSLIPV